MQSWKIAVVESSLAADILEARSFARRQVRATTNSNTTFTAFCPDKKPSDYENNLSTLLGNANGGGNGALL